MGETSWGKVEEYSQKSQKEKMGENQLIDIHIIVWTVAFRLRFAGDVVFGGF